MIDPSEYFYIFCCFYFLEHDNLLPVDDEGNVSNISEKNQQRYRNSNLIIMNPKIK